MLTALAEDRCDIAVGTRYAKGGGVGAWDATRAKQSRIANSAARLVLGVELTDPMTGFFAIKREFFEKSVRNLSQLGFKILLDIVVSLPKPPRVEEFAYQFRVRERGDSKLDATVVWDFLLLLLDKRIGHIVPARFVSFGLRGRFGCVRPSGDHATSICADPDLVRCCTRNRDADGSDLQLSVEQHSDVSGSAQNGMGAGHRLAELCARVLGWYAGQPGCCELAFPARHRVGRFLHRRYSGRRCLEFLGIVFCHVEIDRAHRA